MVQWRRLCPPGEQGSAPLLGPPPRPYILPTDFWFIDHMAWVSCAVGVPVSGGGPGSLVSSQGGNRVLTQAAEPSKVQAHVQAPAEASPGLVPSARPPPAAERSLSVSRLPARLGTQPPGLQPCGELPVASRVPARLPNPLAAVPLGLALASGDCRGHGSGAREPAAGQPVGRAARPETRAAFVCSLQRSQPWGKRLGGPQAGQAGRWEGGTRGRGAPRWGGAARRLQPPGGGSREARAERGRSD